MPKMISTCILLTLLGCFTLGQAPDTMWLKLFGDERWETLEWVEETSNLPARGEAGFIACGTSRPFGYGNWDAMLILTDASGDTIWFRIFDLLGRKIESLYDEIKPAGGRSLIWRADKCNSGVYFLG